MLNPDGTPLQSLSYCPDPKVDPTPCTKKMIDVYEYRAEDFNRNVPSIITIVIDSMLPPGTCPADMATKTPLFGDSLCGAFHISFALLIVVVINVPMMLCLKPCAVKCAGPKEGGARVEDAYDQVPGSDRDHNRINRGDSGFSNERSAAAPIGGGENYDGSANKVESIMAKRANQEATLAQKIQDMGQVAHEESFGDVFIHSMIHTIEFVLGTVSNTASYLRLWALSLAHGQLTEVFFNLSFAQFLNMFGFGSLGVTVPAFLVGWPIFWSCIFFVIMMMDTLECALHTLRLHWVEF